MYSLSQLFQSVFLLFKQHRCSQSNVELTEMAQKWLLEMLLICKRKLKQISCAWVAFFQCKKKNVTIFCKLVLSTMLIYFHPQLNTVFTSCSKMAQHSVCVFSDTLWTHSMTVSRGGQPFEATGFHLYLCWLAMRGCSMFSGTAGPGTPVSLWGVKSTQSITVFF